MAETINVQPSGTDQYLVDGATRLIFLNKGTEADPVWIPLVCQTDGTFNKSRSVSDAASKCNPAGKYSGTSTYTKDITLQQLEGLPTGVAVTAVDMDALLESKEIKQYMIQDETPKKGSIRKSFHAMVTTVNDTDPLSGYSTTAVTLTVTDSPEIFVNTGTVDVPVWTEYTPNY